MNRVGKAFAVLGATIGIGGVGIIGTGIGLTLSRQYNPNFDNQVNSYVTKHENGWGNFVNRYTKWWGGDTSATTGSEVEGVAKISLDLVQSHADEFWAQANSLFKRDTSKNEAYSYTYTPTTIDTERNDAVGFTYEVVASDNTASQFMNVYVKVNDSRTSYTKVQENFKKLSAGGLLESETKKIMETIEEKLSDVVNNEANPLTFNDSNITEKYKKLAEQLSDTIKDEVKDKISGEISSISVNNIELKPTAKFTNETIYKTAIDENSSVEVAEDGTVTVTQMGTEGTNKHQLTEDDYVKDAKGNFLVNEEGKLTYYQHDKDKKGNVLLNKSGNPMKIIDNENCNITYHNVEVKALVKVTTKTGEIYYIKKTVTGADINCENVTWQTGSRSDELVISDIENSIAKNDNPLINGKTVIEKVFQVTNPCSISGTSVKYENGKTEAQIIATPPKPAKPDEATSEAKSSANAESFDEETSRAVAEAMAQYNQEHWTENNNANEQNSTTRNSAPKRR